MEKLRPYRRKPEVAVTHHLLGLDIGSKRIGLAKCDLHFFRVVPCGLIERKPGIDHRDRMEKLSRILQQTIQTHQIVGIVAGFPLMPDNSLTPLAERILEDMSKVNCVYPVHSQGRSAPTSNIIAEAAETDNAEQQPMMCTFWDERESTMNARAVIRGQSSKLAVMNKMKDPFAAVYILDDFVKKVVGAR